MAIRYDITLSTTEPNNDVGVIKIRQADEQTQTLVVQLTATSQPKSYEGLQAFFCAKLGQSIGLGIIEQKLEQSEMTNPKAGQLEYTFRPEDWQQIGRQVGYFSFRKMKDDGHEYVEQFTTRDFYFNVTKNVFSEGLTEVKKDGSTYVWTIEDLIRLFNEYIASGKSDWEEFVDQNREVLESVDPGGAVLSELIRSRKPSGATTAYPDLPTRLDDQIGLNTDFRSFEADKSFMQRVYNENMERGINVKWFGAKGNGVTDDTEAIKLAVSHAINTSKSLYFPSGEYNVSLENSPRNALYWFTDIVNFKITGCDATIIDVDNYQSPHLTSIFAFKRCENIEITGLAYKGLTVNDPNANLHVLGRTFLYFEEKCKKIKVDADVENARYGIRTGDFLDPDYGYCSDFELKIRGKMVGYPVAAYLADNMDISVICDGFHRAVYLAGVFNANVNAAIKNSYGATINVLLTNSITVVSDNQSNQRARGCKNIDVLVNDTGSTQYSPYTALAGIGLQWVAVGTEFAEINIQVRLRSSDLIASSIGGFHLDSSVSGVPFKYEPYIKYKNIKVSGLIDRTSQTVASNQAGEIYVRGYDTADVLLEHCPSFSNISLKDLQILKSANQSRAIYLDTPNLEDFLSFKNVHAPGINLFVSSKKGKIILENTTVNALSSALGVEDLELANSYIASLDFEKIKNVVTKKFETALIKSKEITRRVRINTENDKKIYVVKGALKSTSLTKAIVAIFPNFRATGEWKIGTAANSEFFGKANLNNTNGYNRFTPFNFNQANFPLYSNQDLVITINSDVNVTSGLTIDLYIYEESFEVN